MKLQRGEIFHLYLLQSLVTFLLMNDIFATSLSVTFAFLSEIRWDLYRVAAVCDCKMAWSKYPAQVIWHNSMEITEAMNASPGRGSNSEYMCIWFSRNKFSVLNISKNTGVTQKWFWLPPSPQVLWRHFPFGWKKTSWAIPVSKIILFISYEEPKIAV